MLNGIHLVDFGNHRDTRLNFGRMTALIGQNGAGKTNVMRAIVAAEEKGFDENNKVSFEAKRVRSGALDWFVSAAWFGTLRSAKKLNQEGTWAVNVSSKNAALWLWKAGEKDREWIINPKDNFNHIASWDNEANQYRRGNAMHGEVDQGMVIRPIGMKMDPVWYSQYFKPAGGYLQRPSYSELSSPRLSEDCGNLAWVISCIKGDQDEVFARISESMRRVVPTFRRVKHRPVLMRQTEKKEFVLDRQSHKFSDEHKVMGQELRFDMASGSDLPASAISEGTLTTLATITAMMSDNQYLGGISGTKTVL